MMWQQNGRVGPIVVVRQQMQFWSISPTKYCRNKCQLCCLHGCQLLRYPRSMSAMGTDSNGHPNHRWKLEMSSVGQSIQLKSNTEPAEQLLTIHKLNRNLSTVDAAPNKYKQQQHNFYVPKREHCHMHIFIQTAVSGMCED